MKNLFLAYSAVISLLVLEACNYEDAVNMIEESNSVTTRADNSSSVYSIKQPNTIDLLKTYIEKVKFADVRKDSNGKYSEPSYKLTPYIYEGDIVMYIAQYENGWELLSTDEHIPLVLASSEEGVFPIALLQDNGAAEYIETMAQDILSLRTCVDEKIPPIGLWEALHLDNNKVNRSDIRIKERMGVQNDAHPGNDGYWQLLDVVVDGPVVDSLTQRLTQTILHQEYPWNNYVPFGYNNSNTTHCDAGCVPVALAQYLYFYAIKDNMNWTTPTVYSYDENTNTYTYSSFSNVWNNMATSSLDSFTKRENMGLFIGHLGKLANSNYAPSGTYTHVDSITSVLNHHYGFNYHRESLSFNSVKSKILSGYPMLARAVSTSGNHSGVGHTFLIDNYKTVTTTRTYYYGWVGKDNYGNDTNEFDEFGNVLSYTFYNEQEFVDTSNYIQMNWGINGVSNFDWFAPYNTGWLVASDYLDQNRQIFVE